MEDARLHAVANRSSKHCDRSKCVGGYGVFFTGIVCRSPSQLCQTGRANRPVASRNGPDPRVGAALLPAAPFLIAVRARACRLPAEAGLLAADQ
jgi:hypothetical protein